MQLLSRPWRPLAFAAAVVISLMVAAVLVQSVGARSNVGAPVRQATTGHTISVSGHGETTVAPDEADITAGVQNNGPNAQAALSANATAMSSVIAAIQGQGVSSNRIKTANLSLWYDSEHNVYVAQHSLSVHLDSVNKVGPVLDAAVAAGANNSWGVSFGLKDPSAARAIALQAAVGDARQRANSMASALGVSITGVGSASEASFNSTPLPFASGARSPVASAPTPVQPGELTISSDVSVVFTFG